MGSKGNKRHLVRLNSPGFLRIPRKEYKFFMKPSPGPHPARMCLPLGHILRDFLKITHTARETKFILNSRRVKVDGRVVRNPKFPVGLMDVLEIPEINKAYRILPSQRYGLVVSEITKEEAQYKLCRIENITTVKGGHLQLNLHDGRNILIRVENPQEKPNIPYKTKGTLKISIPDQEILDYFPMEENNQAIIAQGKNIGISGKIIRLEKRFGVNASLAVIETSDNREISTAYDYAFVIGREEPSIDLPPDGMI